MSKPRQTLTSGGMVSAAVADRGNTAGQGPPFWTKPLSDLLAQLATDGEGLGQDEAEARLRRFGLNQPARRSQALGVLLTLRHVVSPLAVILLIAATVSATLGQVVDAVIIISIVLFSATIDILQARRSQRAAERLRQQVELQASVKRDGQWAEAPVRLLVPGDRVRLSAGDIVPADGRLIRADALFLDEASFTGESLPVEKEPAETCDSAVPSAARNALFMGTVVKGGSGEIVVARTGADTTYAQLAARLQATVPRTAFDRGIRDFGLLIARTVAVLVVFVVVVNLLAHRDPLESVLFAVALAVGLTPEFLPMILTVTQAEGALRMARVKVIVRQLSAIQNFGSMDVLCSDKTGTLTEGRMQVSSTLDANGSPSEQVRLYGYVNAFCQTGLRSPFDEALLAAKPAEATVFTKLGEIPYDFERRCLSVAVELNGNRLLITKGAPESVLSRCCLVQSMGTAIPLGDGEREQITRSVERLGEQGFRLLAVASRMLPSDGKLEPENEREMIFQGIIAFSDPIKDGVAEVITALQQDGITLKILTGDAEAVTRHVCEALGLVTDGIVMGDKLDSLSDEALGELVNTARIFARVDPEQKLRIISALQRRKYVVGFLGDGINDAPSLRAADVGISVSEAVDVAREAAQIILMEKSLSVLHQGVIEGRKSFGNVIKYIMMGTSSNFGNMLSMAGAVLFLPFLPMLAPQVLLNNALYDLSQVTIPLDRVDPEFIRKPHGWDMRFIRDFMLMFGPISSLYDFLTFFILLSVFHAQAPLFHTGWFVESLTTQTLVVFVIRTPGNPFRSRPSPVLAGAAALIVAVGMVLPWTPLASPLGFVAPPATFMLFVVATAGTYLVLVEVAKRFFFRYHPLGAAAK